MKRRAAPFWTDEEVAKLKKLDAEGLSYSEVGKILKRTRNMVSGKLHRLREEEKQKARAYG